jgi:hypothetical protein
MTDGSACELSPDTAYTLEMNLRELHLVIPNIIVQW